MVKPPLRLHISYADQDAKLVDELEAHLSPLRREGLVQSWSRRSISLGEQVSQAIAEHIDAAHIIVLMLSADYVQSDHCYQIEMAGALRRHQDGQAYVLPVLARAMDGLDGGRYQGIPVLRPRGHALGHFRKHDRALASVARTIRQLSRSISQGHQPRPFALRRWVAAAAAMAVAALLAATLAWALVPVSIPPGGVVLQTTPWERPLTPFASVCQALSEVAPDQTRCVFTLRPGRAVADALTVTLHRDGTAALRQGEPWFFPLGAIGVDEARGSAEALAYLAQVLHRLSRLSTGQHTTELPDAAKAPKGSDPLWVLLGALVHAYHAGGVAESADALDEGQLKTLRSLAHGCLEQPAQWHCPLAIYLYALRCDDCAPILTALRGMAEGGRFQLSPPLRSVIARRLCQHDPQAALALLAPLLATPPCEAVRYLGIATCLQRTLPTAAHLTALSEQPAAAWSRCDPEVVGRALGERGLMRMAQGRWQDAAADFALANQHTPHPSYLLNQAECLLHLGRDVDALALLGWGRVGEFSDARDKAQALLLRWLALSGPREREEAGLLALLESLPKGHKLIDDDGTLEALLCPARPQPCQVLRLLGAPAHGASPQELRALLRSRR